MRRLRKVPFDVGLLNSSYKPTKPDFLRVVETTVAVLVIEAGGLPSCIIKKNRGNQLNKR